MTRPCRYKSLLHLDLPYGHPAHHGTGPHVPVDEGAGPHGGPVAYGDARQDQRVGADHDPLPHPHLPRAPLLDEILVGHEGCVVAYDAVVSKLNELREEDAEHGHEAPGDPLPDPHPYGPAEGVL